MNNGHWLYEHCVENVIRVNNNLFKKKGGKLWMFISDMNGNKSQIDFVLVYKKKRNSVYDKEAYNCFRSMGSDQGRI